MADALRVHVLSDLHVDYLQNRQRVPELAEELAEHESDAFVLAGDVSHKLDQVEETLRQFADVSPRRMFVAGNHDVWVVRAKPGEPTDSWAKLDALGDLCKRSGYAYLEREAVTINGFRFLGTVGWYDYSYASPAMKQSAEQLREKRWQDLTYMDREYAKWGIDDADVVERLTKNLALRLRTGPEKTVFASHHVPLEELVLRRGAPAWDFFNAYMGSRKMEAILRAAGVTRFIFGHTHRPVNLVEDGRCIINNPLGYPRQALNPIRSPFLIT